MRNVRILLVVLILVALFALSACSSNRGNLDGDGLHATVPPVTGKTLLSATAALQDAGYEVGSVAPAGSKGSAPVTEQDPAAGTALPRGGQVNLKCGD